MAEAVTAVNPFGPFDRAQFFNIARHAPAGMFGCVVRGDGVKGMPGWQDTWGPLSESLPHHDKLWGLEGASPAFADLMAWVRANSPASGCWESDGELLDDLAARVAESGLDDDGVVALLNSLGIDPRDDDDLQHRFGLENYFPNAWDEDEDEDDEGGDEESPPAPAEQSTGNVVQLHPEAAPEAVKEISPEASNSAAPAPETPPEEITDSPVIQEPAAMPDPFTDLPATPPAFVMERAELVRMLTAAVKVAPRTTTLPILENVLIQAERGGGIRLTTTDLNRWLAVDGTANVTKAGAVTVPAKTFADMICAMPEGSQVELSPRDGRMAVLGGRTRFSLPALPPAEFPPAKLPDNAVRLEVGAETLHFLFRHTSPAASTQDARPYLNGINLRTASRDSGLMLLAEASNAFLSSTVEVPAPGGVALPSPYLIPTETVAMVLALFTAAAGGGAACPAVDVTLSEALLAFEAPGLRFVSKLVDQTFPALERIIQDTLSKGHEQAQTTIDVRDFKATLRRIQLAAEAKKDGGIITKEIRLSCDGQGGGAHIVVSTPPGGADQAAAEEAVDAPIDGDFGTIGVNSVLLSRALDAAPGETACLRLYSGNLPLLVMTCPAPEHQGFSTYLTLHRI